jgi:serralysin
MRRRALLILAILGLGVMLLGGVALADTIEGTNGPDDLVGTDKDDIIGGKGSADYISGLAATDLLYGGSGNDTVLGREGNDRVYGNPGSDRLYGNLDTDTINSAADGVRDVVNCGEGGDTAFVDEEDTVYKNCENVFVRVR